MSPPERFLMIVVTAYQARLAFIVVSAALLSGALTLRWSVDRRWYDSLSTFVFLTVLGSAVGYLAAHVLLEVPIASVEVLSFLESPSR